MYRSYNNSFIDGMQPDNIAGLQQHAFELLEQHHIEPTPLNYALLYSYAAGGEHSEFNEKIDKLLHRGSGLPPQQALKLFRDYIYNCNPDVLQAEPEADKKEDQGDSIEQSDTISEDIGLPTAQLHLITNPGVVDNEPPEEPVEDELTGLLNRNGLDQQLQKLLNDRRRSGAGFSMVLCEIDGFDDIAGQHLSSAEDLVKSVAKLIQENTRSSDIIARFETREFAILLPGTSLNNAYIVAENIRKQVDRMPLDMPAGVNLEAISLSMGLASHRYGESADSLIQRGLTAMENAKATGHNRSYIAE